MAELSIVEANLARVKIQEELEYLEKCINTQTPPGVVVFLEKGLVERQALMEALDKAESIVTLSVADEVYTKISSKEVL